MLKATFAKWVMRPVFPAHYDTMHDQSTGRETILEKSFKMTESMKTFLYAFSHATTEKC